MQQEIISRFKELGPAVLSNPWFGVGGLERVYLAVTSIKHDAIIVAAKNFHDPETFSYYFGSHLALPRVHDVGMMVEGDSPLVRSCMAHALWDYSRACPGACHSFHVTNHWSLLDNTPFEVDKELVYFQPGVWEIESLATDPFLKQMYTDRLESQECVVLANSKFMAGMIKEVFDVPEPAVLYPCTDVEFFTRAASERAVPVEEKPFDILIFSRLNPGKRFTEAIRLFKAVLDSRPGTKFTLAGAMRSEEQGFLDALRSEARKEGLGNSITFKPNPSLSDLATLYSDSKLMAFLPRNEPLGLVAVEAMASGVPVVGYASGGIMETVVHGKTGHLCEDLGTGCCNDGEPLASALLGLLSDQEKIERLRCKEGSDLATFSAPFFLKELLAHVDS